MHFNKVGKKLKPNVRFKMKKYLGTKMGLVVVLLNKYGKDAISDF